MWQMFEWLQQHQELCVLVVRVRCKVVIISDFMQEEV